jgi:acetaldehyde dehydrogenase (acetylating)
MIVDRPLVKKVVETTKREGGYFVNTDEKAKLAKALKKGKGINPEIVGKSAPFIAEYAGFSVPANTRVLIAECDIVGEEETLSIEKLSPILAFYVVDGWLEGCHKCIELLEFGGIGHSMAIHSNDKDIIMKFALEKPAFRIVVNTPSSIGAVGYTTMLTPSLTLGPGTWGGSIVSENVSAYHLMNVKTLAFESNPVNKGNSVTSFDSKIPNVYSSSKGTSSFMDEIEARLLARAGNPSVSDKPNEKAQKIPAGDKIYGSGISEAEIQKIISEFNK